MNEWTNKQMNVGGHDPALNKKCQIWIQFLMNYSDKRIQYINSPCSHYPKVIQMYNGMKYTPVQKPIVVKMYNCI